MLNDGDTAVRRRAALAHLDRLDHRAEHDAAPRTEAPPDRERCPGDQIERFDPRWPRTADTVREHNKTSIGCDGMDLIGTRG